MSDQMNPGIPCSKFSEKFSVGSMNFLPVSVSHVVHFAQNFSNSPFISLPPKNQFIKCGFDILQYLGYKIISPNQSYTEFYLPTQSHLQIIFLNLMEKLCGG